MNEEILDQKALKTILIVIIIGFLLITADLFLSGHSRTLSLYESDRGLYMVRPSSDRPSGKITLKAEVSGQDYSKKFDIVLAPLNSEEQNNAGETDSMSDRMTEKELVGYEVRNTVRSLNENTARSRIYLPDRLSSGEKISWSEERNTNTAPIFFCVLVICALVFRNRYAPLKKKLQEEQNSITRQLPEFINRIVLLLNAGLVLNSAFEKAVEESSSNDYFYSQMKDIHSRVVQANSSMYREFRDFAKSRSAAGDEAARELMRISNIINDNISKGVELTEKLQAESEMLWLARKRNCEERGRLAETKLTLPLTLFLLVLIVITVSPALLEL